MHHRTVRISACVTGALVLFAVARVGASDYPYIGVVTADAVDVRSGAGESYYVTGRLRAGALVQVHGHFHRWYKIVPPKGVHSFVPVAFVNRSGDGALGTVTRDRVVVKAAAVDGPPGASYRQQRFLPKGERVQIVSEEGDFYRILPPKDAFVFLPPETVRPATAEQVAQRPAARPAPLSRKAPDAPRAEPRLVPVAPSVAPPEAPRKVAASPAKRLTAPVVAVRLATPPAPNRETPRTEVATAVADRTVDDGQFMKGMSARVGSPLVAAAESRLRHVSRLSLDEQPIEQLMETYQRLSAEPGLSRHDRLLVKSRLLQLEQRERLILALKDVADFRRDLKSRSPYAVKVVEPGRPLDYAVVGQLLSSVVYNGEQLPMLYRLVEPASMRTVAYVRAGPQVPVARHLGRLVGVVGATQFDSAVNALVVEADRVDLLEPVITGRTTQATGAPARPYG